MFSMFKSSHKRTIFLALFATFVFITSAVFMFDVDSRKMMEFFVVSVVCLLFIILAAFSLSLIRFLWRKFFGG